MLIEIVRPREPLLATVALEWPLHRVRPHMSLQVFHALKQAATAEKGANKDFCGERHPGVGMTIIIGRECRY
jgi:hypothetical protein